jgi:hypothetical protein
MTHDIPDDRNVFEAQQSWDSGLTLAPESNMRKLLRALLSEYDRIDGDLEQIYHAQHINDAAGSDLDKFGELVQTPRKTGESDDKYRARIKAAFRVGNIGTTADQFIEFGASILNTDPSNVSIDYPPNRTSEPAEINFRAAGSLFSNVNLTDAELKDLLNDAVPAGHEVSVIEEGTFEVKADGATDDPDKGLTADGLSTGGTLAVDLV